MTRSGGTHFRSASSVTNRKASRLFLTVWTLLLCRLKSESCRLGQVCEPTPLLEERRGRDYAELVLTPCHDCAVSRAINSYKWRYERCGEKTIKTLNYPRTIQIFMPGIRYSLSLIMVILRVGFALRIAHRYSGLRTFRSFFPRKTWVLPM